MTDSARTLDDSFPQIEGASWDHLERVSQAFALEPVDMADRGPEPPRPRVPFAVPIEVQPADDREIYEGCAHNLSLGGMGCTTAATLTIDAPVSVTFRMSLGEVPATLAARVAWVQGASSGTEPVYGLEFLDLTPAEEQRLELVVRERAEGRAGEWPLPVMPTNIDCEVRGYGGLSVLAVAMVAAAAGTAVGLVFPELHSSWDAQRGQKQILASDPVEARAPTSTAALPPSDAPGPKGVSKSLPTLGSVAPPAAEVAQEPDPKAVGDARILRPELHPDRLELTLEADAPVEQHVTFWLDAPRRLVIDAPGRANGFEHLSYTVEHPLATKLRVGVHPNKVRYVIETHPDVSSDIVVRRHDAGLRLELRLK